MQGMCVCVCVCVCVCMGGGGGGTVPYQSLQDLHKSLYYSCEFHTGT